VLYSTENPVISAIGAAGSKSAGQTLITLTGVWTTPPSANDLLMVVDGTEQSARVMVVLEDIVFDGVTVYESTGFYDIDLNKANVNNITYFDNSKMPTIVLLDVS
jgi:hypothetical protein